MKLLTPSVLRCWGFNVTEMHFVDIGKDVAELAMRNNKKEWEKQQMDKITFPDGNSVYCHNGGEVSDGYHTFAELYDHRCHLFIALMRSHPKISWRANVQADGEQYPNWFIAGMHLPTGDISYHLPCWMWTMLDGCRIQTTHKAPEWDGHTPKDVVDRLAQWFAIAKG